MVVVLEMYLYLSLNCRSTHADQSSIEKSAPVPLMPFSSHQTVLW